MENEEENIWGMEGDMSGDYAHLMVKSENRYIESYLPARFNTINYSSEDKKTIVFLVRDLKELKQIRDFFNEVLKKFRISPKRVR